jgi:sulfatase modifying factor 1
MQANSSQPATTDVRQFLTETFSDEELSTLCFDYFRDVYDDFASGMTKGQKIQILIERCERHGVLPNLLAAIQRARPEQYKGRFPQVEIQPEHPRLERDPRQVFISHARQDANFAHRLAKDLQRRGWRVWIAPDSIRPGEKWGEAIDRGLGESGIFVAVLTPASVQSRWVKNETYVAIELESKGHLRFVPLDVERCDVPGLWSVYQRVSFLGGYADGLKSLLADLEQTGQLPTEKPAASPEPPQVMGAADEKPAPRKSALAPRLAAIFTHLPHRRSLLIGAGAVALVALVALAVVTAANKQPTIVPLPTMLPAAVSTRVSEKDGMVMVYVPAGEFVMGAADSDAQANDDEKPQHTVSLDAFWIDRTEVTRAQYKKCVQAGACQVPYYDSDFAASEARRPVEGISWQAAAAYCQWVGRQLPTEAQWEKAARGTDGRIYPWGNQRATCEYAVMNDGSANGCGKHNTWPVGSKPRGASPYGALDMAGNTGEWVADWYDDKYYTDSPPQNPQGPPSGQLRVYRGGLYYSFATAIRASVRGSSVPDGRESNLGFRCVASP